MHKSKFSSHEKVCS